MVLNKRYKRDIRHNLSLYVSTTVLTVLSLLMFYLYHIAGTGILNFSKDFFESQKVEDANFSTYLPIPENEISEIENKYNLELEEQKYINIRTDGVCARVFEKTEKIDIYKVTEGKDVENDSEIVMSEGFAQNNGISVGDKIKIRDKEYTVCGFAERPDYLMMVENIGDADKNITSFYICYMSEDAFEALGEKNFQYLVRYTENNSVDFRRALNEKYVLRSYLSADDNIRIVMMTEQPKLFIEMAYLVLFIFAFMAVLFISVILSRKIKNEQKMIGTLAANGYTKRQIIGHYIGFSSIPGILGGILTTVLVAIFAEPYGALGLMDYEPLDIKFVLNIPQMAVGIIVPTVMYILSTAITVNKLLKNDITALLSSSVKGRNKVKKFLVGKKASIRTKLGIRSVFGNPGRTLVLFLGVFLSGLVVFMGLACVDTVENISDSAQSNMGDYNYSYTLNELMEENTYGGETMLAASVEDEKGNSIVLYGADGNELLGLRDEKGNRVGIKDGYYITSLYSKLEKIKAGDEIKVINPLTVEEFTVKVDGVVENNYLKAIYTTRENTSDMVGIDENLFNVIVSRESLEIPEEKIVTSLGRDTVIKQYENSLSRMNSIIYFFVGIGMVICIISVYIGVNMVISENRANISMLNVLGYDSKRVNKLLLRNNIYIVILAIALSIPTTLFLVNGLFTSFADILGYLMEVHVKPTTYIISVLIVLLGYFISMAMLNRKVKKIDMVESLKDNRE